MALKPEKIDHASALDEWLTTPYKFGHLLGYNKLSPEHDEWIFIFIKSRKFDLLQAHRGSYKTTCGIVAMILLFLCFPDMRLLIVRKTGDLASDVLRTIIRHFETNEVLRLYMYSRWNNSNAKTYAAKEAATNALLNKALQDSNAEFTFDENGNLSLIKKDGTNLFGENHTLVTPQAFIDKSFSKILKVTEAQKPNTQPAAVTGGQNSKNNALDAALEESLNNYQAGTKVAV